MERLTQGIQSVKTASTVAAGTTTAGIGSLINMIPDDIGKLATLSGIILSCVLIYVHLKKGKLERKKLELELTLLESKAKK